MDSTMAAALIASASTLVGTLGTQALGNRRERARDERAVNEGRIDELRVVLEEAAMALHDGIRTIDLLKPRATELPYSPSAEGLGALQDVLDRLELVRTRLGIRIPVLLFDETMRAFTYGVGGVTQAARAIMAAVEGRLELGEAIPRIREGRERARDGAAAFRAGVAFRMGPKLEAHHATLRDRTREQLLRVPGLRRLVPSRGLRD